MESTPIAYLAAEAAMLRRLAARLQGSTPQWRRVIDAIREAADEFEAVAADLRAELPKGDGRNAPY